MMCCKKRLVYRCSAPRNHHSRWCVAPPVDTIVLELVDHVTERGRITSGFVDAALNTCAGTPNIRFEQDNLSREEWVMTWKSDL